MGLARRMRELPAQDSTEKRRKFLHRTAFDHRFLVRISHRARKKTIGK